MRWSLRNQILLPLAAIEVVVVTLVSSWAAWSAVARVEADVDRRLADVSTILESATYPVTPAVLMQVRQLSGADYLLADEDGEVGYSTLIEPVQRAPRMPVAVTDEAGRQEWTIGGRTYRGVWSTPGRASEPGTRVLILYSREHVRRLEREAVAGPVLTGLLILVLTMLATTLVAHRIGRRMQNVGAHVARIAGGQFEPMPLDDRNDEIRDLSSSVNQMGESLKSLTESIRETERTHLTAQVVGGLAHQIRNAMTGIRMAIQVHRRRCAAGPDASLDVALTQIALTEQQIRGLLGLTRNERRVAVAGRPRLLLEEIAAMIEPVCEHRRIEFSCVIDCPTDVTISNADAFRSAVLNLCMNGVEAAGSQGEVGLTAALLSGMLRVQVTDTGPGVPPELAEDVFRPFFTTKPEGIGLGLSLVKQAAENLGGSVEMRRSGERTEFELWCAYQNTDLTGDGEAMADRVSVEARSPGRVAAKRCES